MSLTINGRDAVEYATDPATPPLASMLASCMAVGFAAADRRIAEIMVSVIEDERAQTFGRWDDDGGRAGGDTVHWN